MTVSWSLARAAGATNFSLSLENSRAKWRSGRCDRDFPEIARPPRVTYAGLKALMDLPMSLSLSLPLFLFLLRLCFGGVREGSFIATLTRTHTHTYIQLACFNV